MCDNPLFIGIYPCGVVYADRTRERDGDYIRLAFLCYSTLELEMEPDCPPNLEAMIRKNAATIQAMKGQQFRISTCGQTVLLGSALKSAI